MTLNRREVRALLTWRTVLRTGSMPRGFALRVVATVIWMLGVGFVGAFAMHHLGHDNGAYLVGGLFLGAVIRDLRSTVISIKSLRIGREIVSAERIEQLLKDYGIAPDPPNEALT